MKTTILLLLMATLSYSQNQYVNTTITNVTDTVNVGDSLKINFTFNGNGSSMRIYLWTATYLNTVYDNGFNYQNFKTDLDGSYIYKIKIFSTMGVGDAKIITNVTSNGFKFYIKDNISGIEEYNKSFSYTTKYYDIYGKEKPSIEGLTIRVTTYSNGYQKKDKIILPEQ
jgi:hypothetical protein